MLYQWTPAREKAFQAIKTAISTAPVMARPDMQKSFILYTDASQVRVGAILVQKNDKGFEHPIYFASKSLSSAEKNWSATELEAWAVVWAIGKFYHFLAGAHFEVFTDHQALQ